MALPMRAAILLPEAGSEATPEHDELDVEEVDGRGDPAAESPHGPHDELRARARPLGPGLLPDAAARGLSRPWSA